MVSEIIGSSLDPEKPPTTHVFRRQFVACLNCRKKKIKCHMQDDIKKCVRCERQNIECVIPPRKPYVWKQRGLAKKNNIDKVNKPLIEKETNNDFAEKNREELLADKNLIRFSTVPKIGISSIINNNVSDLRTERQNIHILNKIQEDNVESNMEKTKNEVAINNNNNNSNNSPEQTITTTHGALAFLTDAANNPENINKKQTRIDQSKITDRKLEPSGYWELDMSIADNQLQQRLNERQEEEPLEIIYARILQTLPFLKDLLNVNQIENLIQLFFLTQHPFYPFVPTHLQTLRQLYRFPLLLLTILTISSRYQNGKQDDYEKTHNILWSNCQQMLSQTIWASVDSFGSLGTIFAFLLFTEWNPRSIHSKVGDYATVSNGNSDSKEFESLRRSENLSFMLSGSALRVANSLNVATKTGNLLLALQITELNVTMNFNLENNLNILRVDNKNINHFNKEYNNELEIAKKYVLNGNKQTLIRWNIFTKKFHNVNDISESLLINFWQDEKLLYYKHKSVFNNGFMNSSSSSSNNNCKRTLFLDRWQRAEIKMLEMIKLSYETLYYSSVVSSCEEPFYANSTSFNSISTHPLDMNDCINFLKFLQIIINNWYEQFEDLLKPIDPVSDKLVINEVNIKDAEYVLKQAELRRGEWFIIDFHYCKIYGFAIVLEFFHKKKNIILHHSNMQLIDYLKDCYISCQYIHDSCLRLMKADLLPYLPIRILAKIIRSIAFLVKMYIYVQQFKKFKILESKKLLLNLRFIKIEDILLMIKNWSKCLKKTAPDSSHLGLHYSKILKFLYEKISTKENIHIPDEEEDEKESKEREGEKEKKEERKKRNNNEENSNATSKPQESTTAKDDMFDILFNYKELATSRFSTNLFNEEHHLNSIPMNNSENNFNGSSNLQHNFEFGNPDNRPINTAFDDFNVIDDILGLNYDSDNNSGFTRPNSAAMKNMSATSEHTKSDSNGIKHSDGQGSSNANNIISSVSIFDIFGDII
ncbi:hypothetical protein ACO0SA_003946 [Hanseniaspora valbyensis]